MPFLSELKSESDLLHLLVGEAEHAANQLQHLPALAGRRVEVAKQQVLHDESVKAAHRQVM